MSRNGAPLQLQKKIASFSRARLHKACGVCLHSMICHGFSLVEYSSHREPLVCSLSRLRFFVFRVGLSSEIFESHRLELGSKTHPFDSQFNHMSSLWKTVQSTSRKQLHSYFNNLVRFCAFSTHTNCGQLDSFQLTFLTFRFTNNLQN